MKYFFKNQKGSTMVLVLLSMVILAIFLSGLIPMINSQLSFSSLNNDAVEAQYAAEAGAKRAIVGLKNNRTDWAWATGNVSNLFIDGTTKYYTTSISPTIADTTSPISNTKYTITANGYVGNAHKKVTVIVQTPATASGPFTYATFSKGDMLIQNPLIIGDIYSNGNIKTTSAAKMVTGTAYSKTQSIENSLNISNGYKQANTPLVLDINSIIPALAMTGTNLTTTWTNGQWGNSTYPLTSGSYYYNGDYDLNGHSYSIAPGENVTIYVNGTFNLDSGSSITGGNLTIYAKNNINFNGGLLNNSVSKVYAGGNIQLSSNSSITNTSGMLVAKGTMQLAGGSATNTVIMADGNVAGQGGSVAGIYTNGTVTMTGAAVTYNNTVMQSLGFSGDSTPFSIVSWGN